MWRERVSFVMPDDRRLLRDGAASLGVVLDDSQLDALLTYLALLAKWNRAYNLTAVRNPAEMLPRHLLDSLSVVPFVSEGPVLDVGSGAGLPGIPLAIVRPELSITLLDSNGKKSRFQFQAVAELGLRNVAVVQARVEEFHPPQPFALITSRAFAELADFVTLTEPLLAEGGHWLAMKAARTADELKQLPERYKVIGSHQVAVPGADQRQLVEIARSSP